MEEIKNLFSINFDSVIPENIDTCTIYIYIIPLFVCNLLNFYVNVQVV